MKICSRCKENKELTAFSNDKNRTDGKHCWCKKCSYEVAKSKQYSKKFDLKNPEKRKKYRQEFYDKNWKGEKGKEVRFRNKLKYEYNLTKEDFDILFQEQNGKCKICQIKIVVADNLYIDHNHKNGKVRGLLCGYCNRGLGMFKDNTKYLYQAIKYLEETK